jgi:hypothetical protein
LAYSTNDVSHISSVVLCALIYYVNLSCQAGVMPGGLDAAEHNSLEPDDTQGDEKRQVKAGTKETAVGE